AAAIDTTSALGAKPLHDAISDLQRRARLGSAASDESGGRFGLSPREREVLALVADGRTNRQIAQALFISPKTAAVHVSNVLGKLAVASRGEAAAVAHRLGLTNAS
ncbi:MAG: LuxR C-terminal-related transcriptional regulator, partial [Actinomycetota bacterium]|nr:LuxR C-terminal-related transcriptional regulator [Actinomycetota bacterium]